MAEQIVPPPATTASRGVEEIPRTAGGRRVAIGVLVALLTPALVALAFPPFGVWPLIWVAFVPMVLAQHHVLPARWSPLAVAIGVGGTWAVHFSPGLRDGEVAVVYQLLPLYVALIAVALAWRSRRFHERTAYRWLPFSFPLAWVAIDVVRSSAHETLGATWGFNSYAMYRHPLLLQPLSVLGIHALELLVLLVNWSLAAVVLDALRRREFPGGPRTRARRALAGAVLLSLAWVSASVAMMRSPDADVRVAAVQTGAERGIQSWGQRLARDIEQTREAAARGARLVVWNEGGLPFDPQRERTDEFRTLAAETGAYLVIGYRVKESDGLHRNEVTLLAPNGRFLGTYGKDHPGTFAGDYSDTRGTYPVYRTDLGPLSTIICYDLDFTDTARKMALGGARLVATPSADVPAIARTHYTHLVFRAIENRMSMVKADNEFDSAVIDPYGRILSKTVHPGGGGQATLVADVTLGSGRSPWVSLGNWFGWATVIGAPALRALAGRARRRLSPPRPVTATEIQG